MRASTKFLSDSLFMAISVRYGGRIDHSNGGDRSCGRSVISIPRLEDSKATILSNIEITRHRIAQDVGSDVEQR